MRGIADLRLSRWAERRAHEPFRPGIGNVSAWLALMLGDPDLLVLDEPTTALIRPEWCWSEPCCGLPPSVGPLF